MHLKNAEIFYKWNLNYTLYLALTRLYFYEIVQKMVLEHPLIQLIQNAIHLLQKRRTNNLFHINKTVYNIVYKPLGKLFIPLKDFKFLSFNNFQSRNIFSFIVAVKEKKSKKRKMEQENSDIGRFCLQFYSGTT